MAIASSSSDQKRLFAEKGVKMPKISSGMNKLPPTDLTPIDKAKPSNAEDDAAVISKAKKRFIQARSVESTNRKEGVEDLKFLNNEQWSQADASARAADGRPCITENRLPTFANQIKNDQRQNRPSIVVSPMGDKAAKKDAKMLRGMIRAIERDSNAEVAYDTGFASAVDNGWGYWRVITEYESDKSFDKILSIKSIPNPMNVYLDPARTPYGLDAGWGFISEMLAKDEFEREYPDASPIAWGETGIGESDKDWITAEEIRVAEYYYFEYDERELILLDNGHQGWEDELHESVVAAISSGRVKVMTRRTVHTRKLKWAKITAIEVLDSKDCDGQYVPIIECDGTILNINGKITKKGIVRDAKGPQKMLNYYSTLETENVALQPKAPWIMEEGQVEGHEDKWQAANRKSFSYLLYKASSVGGKPAPPPQRQPFAGPPAAILAAKQGTVEALKAVTGIRFDATMSERMTDESGRAIRELTKNANLGAYHYIDNFGRALKNTGIVLVDLIPYTYDTKRIVSILDETGAEDRVMINPSMATAHAEVIGDTPDAQGARVKMFNPKIGRYQVTVTIGPSYATKRIEATESQLDFIKVVPQIGQVIADLVAKNSDWEGSEEIAARLAKSIPPNLLTPTRDDMNPQVEALIQGLQQQIQQMTQQTQALTKELGERSKDRDVMYEQISKKFEAEVLKVAQKMEEVAAKKDMHLQITLGRHLAEVAGAIKAFELKTQQPLPVAAPSGQQQQTEPAGSPG